MRYGSLIYIQSLLLISSSWASNSGTIKKSNSNSAKKTTLSTKSSLRATGSSEPLTKKSQVLSRVRKTDIKSTLRLSEKDIQNIQDHKDAIEAADFLIRKSPDGPARNMLILNKAVSLFSLARFQSNQRKSLKIQDQDRALFMEAENQAAMVLEKSYNQPKIKARALFVKGLVRLYLDQPARQLFEESIQVDPNSEHAPWMSLVIAEDLFDQGDFARALPAYQRMYNRLDRSQKELALYKMAWTYVNLNQNMKAERTFAQLIQGSPRGNYSLDASRDLGYVASQIHSQKEIVKMADDIFAKDTERKIYFLSAVNGYYENHGAVQLSSPVMVRLLQLEKDPTKRAQYFLSGVKSSKKPYASKAHLASFEQMSRILEKQFVKKSESLKEAVEIETQSIIRSFLDTYYQKIRSPETLTQDEMAKALKFLLAFHIDYLPESKQSGEVYSVYIRLCENIQDNRCVFEIAEKAQRDENVKEIHEQAASAQLSSLDRLQIQDPSKFRALLLSKAESFMEKYPESKDWLRVAKRRAELLMTIKKFSQAEKVYSEVYKKEESSDNFYNLQWARFQQEEFEDLLGDKRVKKYATEPKHLELQREASLKVAIAARDNKDLKSYKSAIDQFIELKPGPQREEIARKDYMQFLSSQKKFPELQKALGQIPSDTKSRLAFSDFFHATWVYLMENGEFEEAAQLEKRQEPNDPAFYRWVLAQWAQGSKEIYEDILLMKEGPRSLYLLNLAALMLPEEFVDFLATSRKVSKPLSGNLRDLAVLALQIKQGSMAIRKDSFALKLLGTQFEFSNSQLEGDSDLLPVEEKIKAIVLPDATKPGNQFERDLAEVLDKTRNLRKPLLAEIKNEVPLVKSRALLSAAKLEKSIGDLLQASPIPSGLSTEELNNYKAEVSKVANEFFVQGSEFKKSAELFSLTTPQMDFFQPEYKSWKWPSELKSSDLKLTRKGIESSRWLSALVVLDIWATKNPFKKEAYSWIRSGILLLSRSSSAMRAIVVAELKVAGQQSILNEWRSMNEKNN